MEERRLCIATVNRATWHDRNEKKEEERKKKLHGSRDRQDLIFSASGSIAVGDREGSRQLARASEC